MNHQPLLFRFLSPERVEWLAENGITRQSELAEFANQASGRRVVLTVPGETLALTQARVPSRNRAAWLKALPYALEDTLAGDVEDLHLAVGTAQAGMEMPVVIVSHQLMRGWLDACAEAGISPLAIVPDILLLPLEEDSWSLLLEKDRGLLRSGPCAGFAVERENLGLFLQLALSETAQDKPQSLRIWGETAPELDQLPVDLRYQAEHRDVLQVLAKAYDSFSTLNLLQGPYSRRAHLGKWLRPWRSAAALAGLWLILQMISQVYEYWHLTREQANLRVQMEQVYRDTVPDARKIVNAKAQLENRLRELRQDSSGSEAVFLELLYHGSQPLLALQGVSLRGLRYKDDQLDLDLEGTSLEVLDQLKQRFTQQTSLNAEMRTTKREDKVESQISLKRTPS